MRPLLRGLIAVSAVAAVAGACANRGMLAHDAGGADGPATGPGDGPAGATGGDGAGGRREALGHACAGPADCESGFCADGLCCDSDCSAACHTCAGAGSLGTCLPADVDTDPRDECDDMGAAGCGTDGVCDGAGACRKYPAGSICRQPSCTGSTLTQAFRCDGDGACLPTSGQPCDPYVCGGNGACLTTCARDADCRAPNVCTNGSCGKQPLGGACAAADDCNSGICAQGVCCATTCAGTCRSCAVPGSAGTCANVPAGDDPLGQCADQGAASCATDGSCDGAGRCRSYAPGTVCAPPACTGTTATLAGRCSASGACTPGTTQPCDPYACGGNGQCRASCADDRDCSAGKICAGTICTSRPNGAACTANADCASGSCAQGVCCATACAGVCQSCALAGRLGACSPVAVGQDPLDQCGIEDVTTCGTEGTCNGNGACRLHAVGAVCAAASCAGSTLTLSARCDGAGDCAPPAMQPCTPYVCGGPSSCLTTCATGADCTAGNVCTGGSCGKRPLGSTCAAGGDCASGICAQGVCCQTACTGVCLSCAVPATAGTCSPVPAGEDPLDQCATAGAATCRTNGACNGSGACQLYAAGTACSAATCSGSTFTPGGACDGAGACVPGTPAPCAPYVCGAAAECLASCRADADCVAPFICNAGVCSRKPLGVACAAGAECASGLCQQGFCCGSSCTGTCRSCALPGSLGTCAPVPTGQDPLNQCADAGAAGCGTDGFCDGAGACRNYAPGTTCVPPSCTGATRTPPRTCNGAGTCQAVANTMCDPYNCDTAAGACKTTCATSADCVAPNTCVGGSCGKLPNGAACTSGPQCNSGNCAQGFCCNSACAGTCQSCALAGLLGTCTSVPAGQDPLNQCAMQATNTCGTDGFCNGSGACRLFASGTVCRAAAGGCDVVETCNGSVASCPADAVLTPPPAPAGLTATPGNAQVTLSWTAAAGATGYAVKRATTSGGPYATVATPAATGFVDTGVSNGTTYFYVVTATSNAGGCESAASAQAMALPTLCASGIYCANFESDALGTTLPAGWTRLGGSMGDWSVVANAADTANPSHVFAQNVAVSSTPRYAFATGGTPPAPWSGATTVSADVKLLAVAASGTPQARVCLRFTDTSNSYCLALLASGGAQIQTTAGGTVSASAVFPTTVAVGAWYRVELGVDAAGVLRARVGGAQLGTFTPPAALPSGRAALGTQSAQAAFDNVVVTQP